MRGTQVAYVHTFTPFLSPPDDGLSVIREREGRRRSISNCGERRRTSGRKEGVTASVRGGGTFLLREICGET